MTQLRCRQGQRKSCRVLACLVAVLLAGASYAGPAKAQYDSPYTVQNVAVDVTADTAAAARTQARSEGRRLAFQRLLERLVPREQARALAQQDDTLISDLVEGFEVAEEKASSVRYIAKLIYHFNPEGVQRMLQSAGVAFAETRSKPVLILPLYDVGGEWQLWDEPNPWRDAWSAMPPRNSLVPFVVPFGDLADITDIDAVQAINGDAERIEAIGARYGAGTVLVAAARMRPDKNTGLPKLRVNLIGHGKLAQAVGGGHALDGRSREDVDGLLQQAVALTVAVAEEKWKQQNLLRFDSQAALDVVVPIRDLTQWLTVRQGLAGTGPVRRADVTKLSRSLAHLTLHFLGSTQQLQLALAQNDLTLDVVTRPAILHIAGEEPVLPANLSTITSGRALAVPRLAVPTSSEPLRPAGAATVPAGVPTIPSAPAGTAPTGTNPAGSVPAVAVPPRTTTN